MRRLSIKMTRMSACVYSRSVNDASSRASCPPAFLSLSRSCTPCMPPNLISCCTNPSARSTIGFWRLLGIPGKRHKGLVENAVGLIQRRILNPLMSEQFLSIEDINERLCKELEVFNNAPLSGRTNTTRETLFQEEKPLLGALPPTPYDPARIVKTVKVGKNYQIRWNNKRYSVPYIYAGCTVKVTEFPRDRSRLVISNIKTGEVIAEYILDDKVRCVIRYDHLLEQHKAMMLTAQQLKELISLIGPSSKGLADIIWARCQGPTRTKALRHLNSL